jgi:hypothetical protein
MNSSSSKVSGVKTEKLDQVPATIKPISAPSEKERFETDLIRTSFVPFFVCERVGDDRIMVETIRISLVEITCADLCVLLVLTWCMWLRLLT